MPRPRKRPGRGGTSPRRARSRPARRRSSCSSARSRGRPARASDAVSVRARLGTEADDFFHTQFHGESVAFSSDASAGLRLKTHRRGAEAEEDAEKDIERVAQKPAETRGGEEGAREEVEPVAKKPSREVDETPRDEGKAASNATVASKASKASKTSKTRSETKALDDRVELSGAVDKKHADPPTSLPRRRTRESRGSSWR